MQEVFRGWRRKVGSVTLVMTCVLASAWVYGFSHRISYQRAMNPKHLILDIISIDHFGIEWLSSRPIPDKMLSERQQAIVWFNRSNTPYVNGVMRKNGLSVRPADRRHRTVVDTLPDLIDIKSREYYGLEIGSGLQSYGPFCSRVSFLRIPLWSIAIPMTLLSAWLLLSKPRSAKKPDASPPTDPDHA